MDNDRGQSLITKYVWVIETIYRRRKISFKELNELWLRDDISRGVEIEMLEPLWLRKEIAGKIKRMWNKYKEDE